jgi:hypothetical protein
MPDGIKALFGQLTDALNSKDISRPSLAAFLKVYPPHPYNALATEELLGKYEGRVAEPLLELWRHHGFGIYGALQLQLIDPEIWQATLDRWIVSPPDLARPIPIAITPFGTLLHYRRLTAADEEIASLNPLTWETDALSGNLVDFFNRDLLDAGRVEGIMPRRLLMAAQEKGLLGLGEIYEADPLLLPMQILSIRRVDALNKYKQWRDGIDGAMGPNRSND